MSDRESFEKYMELSFAEPDWDEGYHRTDIEDCFNHQQSKYEKLLAERDAEITYLRQKADRRYHEKVKLESKLALALEQLKEYRKRVDRVNNFKGSNTYIGLADMDETIAKIEGE